MALRIFGPAALVEVFPEQHVAHVAFVGVLEVFIVGRGEIEIIDDLGADGAVPPADDGDPFGAALEGRTRIFDGKGAHSDNGDPFAAPVEPPGFVGNAGDELPLVLRFVFPMHGPGLSDPIVDGQNDPLALYKGRPPIANHFSLVAILPFPDPLDVDVHEEPV